MGCRIQWSNIEFLVLEKIEIHFSILGLTKPIFVQQQSLIADHFIWAFSNVEFIDEKTKLRKLLTKRTDRSFYWSMQ